MNVLIDLFEGVLVGFFMSFALGPVFFSIIQTSIKSGFKQALWICLGVILADLLLIFLAFLGINIFLQNHGQSLSTYFGTIGGLCLIAIGLYSFFRNTKTTVDGDVKLTKTTTSLFMGFVLNFFNPANFAAWSAYLMLIKVSPLTSQYYSIAGCILGIFSTEISVAYFATYLRKHLNPRRIYIINLIYSIVFIVTGIIMFIKFSLR